MSYRIIEYSENLDLTDFYSHSQRKGLINNSTHHSMFGCFEKEKEWKGWMVEYKQRFIGGVCLHSFDDVMGLDSYRILARTCWHTEFTKKPVGYLKNHVKKQQNPGSQIFIPISIAYLGKDKNLYATSHLGSNRGVHTYWFPQQEKLGVFSKIKDVFYRGCEQTVWKLNIEEYLKQMKMHSRWECDFSSLEVEKLFND